MASCQSERKFVRVNWVHLTIIDYHTNITRITTSQRSTLHTVHDTFQYSWHESSINSTTDNRVDEHKFTTPRKSAFFTTFNIHLKLLSVELIGCWSRHTFSVWLDNQMNLAKLTSTTALLLMTILCLCLLSYRLTIRNLRFFKGYL